MLDLREIEDEIARLKCGDTSYKNCERLAILTMARDELRAGEEPVKVEQKYSAYSYAPAQSEFVELAMNTDQDLFLEIMDAHMEAIKLVYPKEYNSIINRLKSSKRDKNL